MKQHILFKEAELKEVNNTHVYTTPTGSKYVSITTILSETKPEFDKQNIQNWRDNIGEEEATRIFKQAGIIGTEAHALNEQYLLGINPKQYNGKYDYTINQHHENLKPYINNIDYLYGAETSLYSDVLKTAGTADAICKYKGKNSIVDYKTKRSMQKESYMRDYYIQTTAYAQMFYELSGIKIDQLVILCSIVADDEDSSITPHVREFISEPSLWKDSLQERLDQYYMKQEISNIE